MLLQLPVEVLQRIVYETGVLNAIDVLSLLQTCKDLCRALRGDAFDLVQHRALADLGVCINRRWTRAAILAFKRFRPNAERLPYCFNCACFSGNTVLVDYMLRSYQQSFTAQQLEILASRNRFGVIDLLLKNGLVDATQRAYREAANRGYTSTATLIRLYLTDGTLDL
ncbi:MAG: hypothetical protein CMP20_01855 [Rickettsiales bacterium]|nr:hypothetical protein [Rickettsiales bacterium]